MTHTAKQPRRAGAGQCGSRPVQTPRGTYASATQAAAAHGLRVAAASRRARLRLDGWRYLDGTDRAWPAESRPHHHRARRVRTPRGEFPSAALAAEAHGMHPGVARKRARCRIGGWWYVDAPAATMPVAPLCAGPGCFAFAADAKSQLYR